MKKQNGVKQKKNAPAKKLKNPAVGVIHSKHYVALGVILLITYISYLVALHNGFVNWDDENYIQNNPLIKTIDFKAIFSGYIVGNYHPLTILIYAVEYHFFGLKAGGYHAVSLFLHLFNTVLVFYVIFHLGNEAEIALIAALLFGIHPVHVESVAWASELKDLLYAFFFLGSYNFYLIYLSKKSKRFYIFSLLLFLLSLLSKAMAASLPVVLILTDYFIRKDEHGKTGKMTKKTLLEKVPFFVLSLIFGAIALFAQRSLNSIHDISFYSFPQRIIFACYGFINYLVKLIAPFNLCAFYPYPVKSGESLPAVYYIFPILLAGLIVLSYLSLRFTKKIVFSFGFFVATVFLVLQLLPVGDAVMADRYCYIPSVAIFYLGGEGIYWLWTKKNKMMVGAFTGILTIVFSVMTYSMCGIWRDGMTLWDNVISHYETVPIAYNNRGYIFMNDNKYKEAESDFNKAIELKPDYVAAYNNRGSLLRNTDRYDEMLRDFNKAIELSQDNEDAYNNRGNVYMKQKKYDEAIRDFNNALKINPGSVETYNNRGIVYMKQQKYPEAMNDFNKAIRLDPGYAMAYANRGIVELNTGKKESACMDLQKSIDLGFLPAANFYNEYCH